MKLPTWLGAGVVHQHPNARDDIDRGAGLNRQVSGHGSGLVEERRGIHRNRHHGWRDAAGGRNRNAGGVGTDAEGRVIAAWIDDGELLGGDALIAEACPEYQIFLLRHYLGLLGQAADRQDGDAAF